MTHENVQLPPATSPLLCNHPTWQKHNTAANINAYFIYWC